MTDKNPRTGEYMTLSHCWGAAQFITLRKDNLAELGQGIQLEKLPKTFQDAVAVAQWFKIKYLWIDSLCILQDSKEDWVKESATMRSVYSHSIMSISATGAVDPSIGCFLDRQSDNIRPFSALVSGSEIEHICFDDNFWRANISDAPLSKRAWAFQERLLSPRILHFGAIQMSWECMESASCETFPEGVPFNLGYLPSIITKREFFDHTQGQISIHMWNRIVNYYTSCAMTVPSDIYLAFAGVVEDIHSLAAEEYFAGFWRKDLELQLLWERNSSATWKPTGYRAPSWSWFSVNGAVHFPWLQSYDENLLYEVLDVIVHNSAEGLYGPVTYGCLRCRGILGTAVRQGGDQHWVIPVAHGQRLESKAAPLWDHITDLSKREVTYLPVLMESVRFFDVLALVLEPTHVKEGEYQRIGTWRIRDEDNIRSVLREQMPGNGAWVDRPQRIFTIV